MTQPSQNLGQSSGIYIVNKSPHPSVSSPLTPNQKDSFGQHPDAPKKPSFISWAFELIGMFFEWVLSWFCKPKPNSEGSQISQNTANKTNFRQYTPPTIPPTTTISVSMKNDETKNSQSSITLNSSDQNESASLAEKSVLKLAAEFQGTIKRGKIHIESTEPILAADSNDFLFLREDFFMVNRQPLDISRDFLNDYTLIEEGGNRRIMTLPKSVFTKARIKNHVYFIYKEKQDVISHPLKTTRESSSSHSVSTNCDSAESTDQVETLYILELEGTLMFDRRTQKPPSRLTSFDTGFDRANSKATQAWRTVILNRCRNIIEYDKLNTPTQTDQYIKNFKGPIERLIIKFNRTSAQYIGQDQQYQFRKNITLLDDSPLRVNSKDLYCDIQITDETGNSALIELPSSLFSQARIGNILYYKHRQDEVEKLFILSLDGNFEGDLKQAERAAAHSSVPFKYIVDILEDYIFLQETDDLIYVSPHALQIKVGEKGVFPLPEDLPLLTNDLNETTLFFKKINNALVWYFDVCGNPDITIILDGCRLMVYIDYATKQIPHRVMNSHDLPGSTFTMIRLTHEEEHFNLQECSATLDPQLSRLTITIPLSLNTPPSQPNTPAESAG